MGLNPTNTATVSHYFATPTQRTTLPLEDEIAMLSDANAFKKSYPDNSVVMMVSNDDMRPFYWPGDYVGGKMRYGDDIKAAVNKDCIVYLQNEQRFFRRLIAQNTGGYSLSCLNPNESTTAPVLYDVAIEGVAPVIWHRRKDE